MPQLKQLSCAVQWANTEIPFQEYGTVYGDGLVESFIVVPNKSQPFTIRLKSLKFIYEGLAMVVFVDGNYQANRNRVNLKPCKKNASLNHTQVDFLIRQKEKPLGEGVYMGRQWRFDNHNIVEDLPEGVNESHFDLLGTIEVLVLRCRARIPEEADDSGSSSGADSDALGEKGDRVILEDVDGAGDKPFDNDVPVEEDEVVGLMGGLLFGGDATNEHDYRYSWNGPEPHVPGAWPTQHHPHPNHVRSHSQHPASAYQAPHHRPVPSFHAQYNRPPAPQGSAPQKHVRFNLDAQQPAPQPPNHHRPPSYERIRDPPHIRPRPFHDPTTGLHLHPHPPQPPSTFGTPPIDPRRYHDEPNYHQQQPSAVPLAGSIAPQSVPITGYGPVPPPPPAAYPYHIPQHSQTLPHMFTHHRPPWLAHPPHLIFNPYYHTQGAAWTPPNGTRPTNSTNANGNTSPAAVADPPADSGNSANSQQQGTMNGNGPDTMANSWNNWNNTTNDATSGSESNHNNNNNGNSNWNTGNKNGGNTADWQNDSNGNNQTDSGNQNWANSGQANDNNDANWNTTDNNDNNDNWQDNQNNGGWDNDASAQNNGDSGGELNDFNNSNKNHGGEAVIRSLFGPHGQYYTYAPRGPDEPGADVEEEPRYDVPQKIATVTGTTKQVLPGSGYMYWKKRRAPEYIDSMEEPYARFVFKYRTKDQLEKEIGIKIEVEPTGDEAVQEFQGMDKQSLIDMLIRAKSALGGKVPSPRLKVTTSVVDNGRPIAVDPPHYSFLNYNLPEPRQRASDSASAAGNTNDNNSGGGGSNTGGGGNNSGEDGGWGTNNNDSSNGPQTNNNASWNNWNSNEQSGPENVNWNRAADGAGDQNSVADNTNGPNQFVQPSNSPPQRQGQMSTIRNSQTYQQSSLDGFQPGQTTTPMDNNTSNGNWTNNFYSSSIHSSPSILPLDPFNPTAPASSPQNLNQTTNVPRVAYGFGGNATASGPPGSFRQSEPVRNTQW